MKRLFCFTVLPVIGLLMLASSAMAALGPGEVPPELERWQAWALHEQREALCPGQHNDGAVIRCQWPARLRLEVTATGAAFEQRWLMFADGWAGLPGGEALWPDSVAVDGQSTPVVDRKGVPSVRLGSGEHRVMGRFTWGRLPEMLPVPAALGLLSLTIDGREVRVPMVDAQGRLWLREGQAVDSKEEKIKVQLFRLLDDTVPMQVTTLLRLDVSGKPREIALAQVLPAGGTPMALDSALPARIDADGRLTLQARAGRWEVRLLARLSGPQFKIPAGPCPHGEEIWSFQARHELRMVEILDATPVEPSQTEMPPAWRSLPAYLLKADESLTIKEIRRGDPDPGPDQLSLQRNWWLDFDGGGFTVQDQIRGSVRRQWSLAMNPPLVLGRVAVGGEERVITEQGPEKKMGVELRRGQLDLQADARLPQRAGALSAVGWDHDFQSVSGVLHLPPGWRLVAASGVDQVSDTWLQRWSLLDFFLVLIIALAVYRLRTWRWGGVALITMALIFHELGAPRLVWLHLLAVLALLPLLPAGWFKRLVQLWGIGAAVALLVTAVPFVVQQIRWGLYPQLAPASDAYSATAQLEGYARQYEVEAAPEVAEERDASLEDSFEEQGRGRRMKAAAPAPMRSSLAVKERVLQQQDPDALIPTGPGLPDWRWQSVSLAWSGPVARSQALRLYLLTPWANLFLALVRVGLLVALMWVLIDWRPWWQRLRQRLGVGTLALVAVAGLAGWQPAVSSAEGFPPPELLEELRQRILEKPDCLPHCADLSRMEITANDDDLQVMLKVNCAARVAVPLPVNRKSWTPEQILLDNAPIGGLARDNGGQMWALIPEGLHTLVLLGNAAQEGVVQIPLPLKPHTASHALRGWRLEGIHEDGSVGSSVQLIRLQSNAQTASAAPARDGLPPFLQVDRVLRLGLTWQSDTIVRRLTPTGAPVVAAIPLLAGESVTTAGIQVQQNQALINMGPDQREVVYSATLPIAPKILLEAPRGVPWTETWVLDASAVWHCDLEGIAVVHHQDAAGQWQPSWQPWPGEQVTIQVSRPPAVAGQTKTIDRADLTLTPGRRFGQGQLQLNLRTSRGGQHTLSLPPNANLQQVTVNGQSLPVQQDGAFVTVPLQPGAQELSVQWQQLAPFSMFYRVPPVKIGQYGVNARVSVQMPENRWILLVGGPRWGPAVLFWSYIVAIVLAALVLGRVTLTPLKTWQWLLLGLGLTQIPAAMALLIIGWLLALGLRQRQAMPGGWFTFDLIQIGLVLWTVAALVALFTAVQAGLVGQPDMQIEGNDSTNLALHWTQDHIGEGMPQPWVFSLPVWGYRLLMLAWSLWLALALLGWLKWGWRSLTTNGAWRKVVLRRTKSSATG
ncbi:MAG: hypothetical protein HZB24_12560 [Desulfobacterales bacterium]|nr:hypothetical protein [Desulfobacterales bacterium]